MSGRLQGPPCRGFRGRRGGKCRWNQAEHDSGIDEALKEAIRRSLQDIKPEEPKTEPSAPADECCVVGNATCEHSECAVSDDDDDGALVAEAAESASVHVIQVAEPVIDTSFSSEAIGHGDAAESLGHTLDDLAHAIDAVVSEIERRHPIHSIEMESQDESVASRFSSLNTLVEDTTDLEAAAGQKIVDGEDLDADVADEVASEASEEEWEVVKEDETEQVASDEMIARAAQLIGSALFRAI